MIWAGSDLILTIKCTGDNISGDGVIKDAHSIVLIKQTYFYFLAGKIHWYSEIGYIPVNKDIVSSSYNFHGLKYTYI